MEQVKNIEAMEITSNSGIHKTVYHNDCYSQFFGKRQ